MENEALKFIGMGLAALGTGIAGVGVGLIFSGVTQGIARNPSAEGKIFNRAIFGLVFAELMGLFAFVLGILIMLKIGS
jgi:F0F1-type ATP synthase membrane subunit c/vacuolar-type H+-ATPase subunit K